MRETFIASGEDSPPSLTGGRRNNRKTIKKNKKLRKGKRERKS
jgi:hypothetical protein